MTRIQNFEIDEIPEMEIDDGNFFADFADF